jgi:hypothetical protein
MSRTNDLATGADASAQRTNSVQGRRTRDAHRVVNITKKWLDKLARAQEATLSKGRQFWYDTHDRHYWIELLPPNRVNHLVRWGKDLRRKIGEYPTMSVVLLSLIKARQASFITGQRPSATPVASSRDHYRFPDVVLSRIRSGRSGINDAGQSSAPMSLTRAGAVASARSRIPLQIYF